MVEYIDDIHQYIVDGIVVPSVTEIISFTCNTYDNVPQSVLTKAAAYGTRMHEATQQFEDTGSYEIQPEDDAGRLEQAVYEYQRLKELHGFRVEEQEMIVYYKQEYAGRLDILADRHGKLGIIDKKATAMLHTDEISRQLGLYKRAYEWMVKTGIITDGRKISWCAALWLPKGKPGAFVDIKPMPVKEQDKMLADFKAQIRPVAPPNPLVGTSVYTVEQTQKIKEFYRLKAEIERIDKEAKQKALDLMKQYGVDTFENNDFKITKVDSYTKKTVDSAKLKKDGLYDAYTKETVVNESVRITPKWES